MKQKRIYRSEVREKQAAQTRSLILEAARKLFCTEGFDRVTIEVIANAASVSVPTIYALFKSKRGLLQSLIDEALPQEQFSALVDDSMQEVSAHKRLLVTAKLTRTLYDAEKEFMDILRGASVVAPELKELEQEREQRRYERQELYVKKMKSDGAISKKITIKQARDILWTLTGRDIYRMLVLEKGWTSDEYEKWLAQLLIQALL